MTILIVDDSSTMRQQLANDLRDAEYEVSEAASSMDAIRQLRDSKRVQLIISDINMPNVDGIEMVAMIRSEFGEDGPPIFVLSAERSNDTKTRARTLGVKAWIVKPYLKENLLNAVAKVLGVRA